jgi:hypothetical protein
LNLGYAVFAMFKDRRTARLGGSRLYLVRFLEDGLFRKLLPASSMWQGSLGGNGDDARLHRKGLLDGI